MNDSDIINLFNLRSEEAVSEVKEKYGKLCYGIAFNILNNEEDAEECVGDLYINLWNAIPPSSPSNLKAYICKAVRNLALQKLRYNEAEKRNNKNTVSLSELEEKGSDNVINYTDSIKDYDDNRAGRLISDFLRTQKPELREVFIRRYWFMDSVEKIAKDCSYSESKVKSMLFRTREKLKKHLRKEGIDL